MMIVTIEVYILTLAQVILTLIQGHRDARKKKKTLALIIYKVLNQFGLNLVGIEICSSDEHHGNFISSDQYVRERTLLCVFVR